MASQEVAKVPKFSESKAYQGFDRFGAQNRYMGETYKPTYYDTRTYQNRRFLSALLSFAAVIIYIGCFREENDIDMILNTPGHILSANLERRMIRTQIEQAKARGEDTALLEAELAYCDVKEAALKCFFILSVSMHLILHCIFLPILGINVINGTPIKENNTLEVVKKVCKMIPVRKNENFCIPPFLDYESKYRIVQKHKLSFCQIDKNLSSSMRVVLSTLLNHNTTKSTKGLTENEWFKYYYNKENRRKTKLKNVANEFLKGRSIKEFLKAYYLVAIVRDPIERFISSFVSKCVVEQPWELHKGNCLNCKNNVTCVITNLYNKLKDMTLNKSKVKNHDYYTQHFVPQTWNCEFGKYLKYYHIIVYEDSSRGLREFYKNLVKILKSVGVTTDYLNVIIKTMKQKRSFNATHDKKERRKVKKIIFNDPYLLEKLIKIYHNDYVQFKLPIHKDLKL
uniref:Sulfotransfer_1 domain-containing protein n=1 Tax=Parastrongyloides trichosuri TaxID=131310 RepID=A0A0N4ZWD6_PARTI